MEPHLLLSDEINVPNFSVIHRTNCRRTRNSEGALILLRKNQSQAGVCNRAIVDYIKGSHFIMVPVEIRDYKLFVVYKSPKYPVQQFLQSLEEQLRLVEGKVVFVGDFNMNLHDSIGNSLLNSFRKYGFECKLDLKSSSTDGGSNLDAAFANFNMQDAWYFESYYSYHKPICIVLKQT